MATYTAAGVAPAGSVNVQAYKATGYAPYTGKGFFPGVGSVAPATPDAGPQAVTPGQAFTLTLPTTEDYILCFVDGSNKVLLWYRNQFHPQRPDTPTLETGNGAPTGTRPNPTIYVRKDGTAGSTLYWTTGNGTWTATTA